MREAGVERRGPFLVWPVSQRDFYMSVALALVPALIWGMTIYGWRILAMVVLAEAGAGLVHRLLRRLTHRGKKLVFAHSFMSVLVLVALSAPMWPVWAVGVAGATMPVFWWLMRGKGRERVHMALAWVVVLQLVLWLAGWTPSEGILARDRLLMGDLRNQREMVMPLWLPSWQLGGDDAEQMRQPSVAAIQSLDRLSYALLTSRMTLVSGQLMGAVKPEGGREGSVLDRGLAEELPAMDLLLLGAVPGRVGAVSLIGIVLGGLYLTYRTILRPYSVALFFGSYVLATVLLMIWPATTAHVGLWGLWRIWASIPGEMVTLLAYVVLNSDVIFAAVFVLALPGTEPLTPRGRRVYLILAGILAASLARIGLGLPMATFVLCGLMPMAGLFDRMFAKRSWLNRMVQGKKKTVEVKI